MAQYQVPQFIEVEDKIFGPLTIKQFVYVAGGLAISFTLWNVLPRIIAIPAGIVTCIFFFSLAFYQFNGKPFIFTVENAVKYFFGNKLYVWRKVDKLPTKKAIPTEEEVAAQLYVPRLSDSKLRDITWSLDINNSLSESVQDPQQTRPTDWL